MASKTSNFKKNNKTANRSVGTVVGSILILFIVIISFVVVPALGDLGQTNLADIELGSYGDEKITFSFINDTPFRQELATLSSSSYGSDSMDIRLALTAYQRAVSKAAAVEEFNSNGYVVTKEQLDDAVLNSGYYNVNGSFNAQLFKNTTEAQKQELRDSVERDIKISSWQYHTLFQQKRSADYLTFISSLSDVKRNFDYVSYDYSEYPEELLLDYANKDTKIFTKLMLSRITLDSTSTADMIIEKLESGESTFAEMAEEYSEDNFKTNGGKLSAPLYAYELESVFGITDIDAILALTPESKPYMLENDGKTILLSLNEATTAVDLTDLTPVRNYMLSYERGMIEDYFFNLVSDVDNLISLGKEIKETGAFSINYGSEQMIATSVNTVSQDPIFSRAVSNDNFFTTLFTLEEDTISEPIVMGDTLTVFTLKEEITDETMTNDYILASLDRGMLNYKSQVAEGLFTQSEKYTNKFFEGYQTITKMNQELQ